MFIIISIFQCCFSDSREREKAEVFGVWKRGSPPDGEVLSVQGDLISLLCLSAAFVSAPDDLMPESFPQGPDEEQQQRAVYSPLS